MDQASPPLADGWIEATAPDGDGAYFINTSTQETRWQRPEPVPAAASATAAPAAAASPKQLAGAQGP